MVWKFYICTTTGLFFCSFPLENCHLPQPLETSCLIGLSVQCIGPWLGQFITLILNPDFFFFMETCLAINLSWRDYQIQSCKPDMNALSLQNSFPETKLSARTSVHQLVKHVSSQLAPYLTYPLAQSIQFKCPPQ